MGVQDQRLSILQGAMVAALEEAVAAEPFTMIITVVLMRVH